MLEAVVVTHSAPPELLDACIAALTAAGGVDRLTIVHTGAPLDDHDPAQFDRDDDGPSGGQGCVVERLQVANRGYGAAADIGMQRAIAAVPRPLRC